MPCNGEIIERSVNEFQKVQKRMLLAKEENAIGKWSTRDNN